MCTCRAVAGGLSRSWLSLGESGNHLQLLVGAKADSWLLQADENERQIECPIHRVFRCAVMVAILSGAIATTPQYQIYDIGVIDVGDKASQGFGVSHGGIAVGRSIRTGGSQAFTWTINGGIVGFPNLAGRNHAVSNSANDNGVVVGTAATTLFGTSRLPVIWQNGAVSQLPLPAGETLGDANSVNASSVAVGSVDGGSLQRGAIYSGGSGTTLRKPQRMGVFLSLHSASTIQAGLLARA